MADPHIAARLRRMPLFQGLRPKELALLTLVMRELHLKPDELLFRQGDIGQECFFILDGAIEVSREQPGAANRTVSVLGKNDLFGQIALIDSRERSATCRALEATHLLRLGAHDFEMLFHSGSQFAFRFQTMIAQSAAAQLRQANAHLNSLLGARASDTSDPIAQAQSILEGT